MSFFFFVLFYLTPVFHLKPLYLYLPTVILEMKYVILC